jgi:hypothetical protein
MFAQASIHFGNHDAKGDGSRMADHKMYQILFNSSTTSDDFWLRHSGCDFCITHKIVCSRCIPNYLPASLPFFLSFLGFYNSSLSIFFSFNKLRMIFLRFLTHALRSA